MTQNLTIDQLRLVTIAQMIAKQDEPTRRADIVEMVTIVRRLSIFEQMAVIDALNDPVALRFLVTSGVQKEARAKLFNKLQDLASIGIK